MLFYILFSLFLNHPHLRVLLQRFQCILSFAFYTSFYFYLLFLFILFCSFCQVIFFMFFTELIAEYINITLIDNLSHLIFFYSWYFILISQSESVSSQLAPSQPLFRASSDLYGTSTVIEGIPIKHSKSYAFYTRWYCYIG